MDNINLNESKKAEMWDKIVEMVGDHHTIEYVFDAEKEALAMMQWAENHALDKLLREEPDKDFQTWGKLPMKLIAICKTCQENIEVKFQVLHFIDKNMIAAEIEPCSVCQGNIKEELVREQLLRTSIKLDLEQEIADLLKIIKGMISAMENATHTEMLLRLHERLVQTAARAGVERKHYAIKEET